MPAVPVGQHLVKNWPVLDLGEQPDIPLAQWKLEVGGLVENPLTLNWQQFMALPQAEDVSDFHCVTTWSRLDNHWKGVRFRTIAELAVPKDEASTSCARATISCPAVTFLTPSTCRLRAPSRKMCCSSTRGKAVRFRASTADRCE